MRKTIRKSHDKSSFDIVLKRLILFGFQINGAEDAYDGHLHNHNTGDCASRRAPRLFWMDKEPTGSS